MKRILLALLLSLSVSPAFAATCLSGATPSGSATLKDAAGSPNTFIAPYSDAGDGSGNCIPNVILSPKQGEAGTPATGVTQPTGGTGLSGWLSGIYHAINSPIPAQASITPGAIIGGVINGANNWNTIAAGSTKQILSATSGGTSGATGDYLSHCIIFPTTTSPGVVTIYDGSSAVIYPFAGGTSSLSNLVPFTIAPAAVSKNGGWEVTTGTGVSASCTGKFT